MAFEPGQLVRLKDGCGVECGEHHVDGNVYVVNEYDAYYDRLSLCGYESYWTPSFFEATEYLIGDQVMVLESNEGLEDVYCSYTYEMCRGYGGTVQTIARFHNTYFSLHGNTWMWSAKFVRPIIYGVESVWRPTKVENKKVYITLDPHTGDNFSLEHAVDKYVTVHGRADATHVTKMMKTIIAAHETVNKALDLNAGNNYRRVIKVEKSHKDIFESFRSESAIIYFLVQEVGGNPLSINLADFTAENAKGQRQKIGRLIRSAVENDNKFIKNLAPSYTNDNFIPHFRELIAKQAGVVISTNPLDLLTPSNICNFSSCHKITGEYSLSAIFNAHCEQTFVAMQLEPNEDVYSRSKSGRMWCWLSPGEYYFNGCQYGTFSNIDLGAVTNFISQGFGIHDGDLDVYQQSYRGVYHDGVYDGLGDGRYETTQYWDPICPVCGYAICTDEFDDYAYGACCYDCKES